MISQVSRGGPASLGTTALAMKCVEWSMPDA
jgi:hypothetical protein